MDTTLILIGVGCIIGAIIGGGVKLVQIELSQVPSLWRQALLGVFGVVLIVWGLVSGGQLRLAGRQASPDVRQADNASGPASSPADTPASPPGAAIPASSPAVEPPVPTHRAEASPDVAPAENAAALPGKVDVFWCVAEEARAQRIADALRATGAIARVRVRPLSEHTNAQPDYQIARNIVRFDPGEQPAARRLAVIASDAAGAGFAAAPALPGSPSVDYLSIFACAPR